MHKDIQFNKKENKFDLKCLKLQTILFSCYLQMIMNTESILHKWGEELYNQQTKRLKSKNPYVYLYYLLDCLISQDLL